MLPLVLLAGCNTLPNSGPVEAQILDAATKPATNPLGFKIVQVDPQVVNVLATDMLPLMSAMDTGMSDPSEGGRIGPGDLLSISVFEIGSTLFSGGGGGPAATGSTAPTGMGASTSSSVTTENLPTMQVGSDGTISVPYVGRLHAAGRTPDQLARAIQSGLAGKSQNPQVLVRITTDIANAVIVSGDIKKPGREPLTLAHERLLDMVAIAGGPTYAPEDTVVQLTRAGETQHIPLKTLEEQPDQNIALRPDDRIQVLYQPRSFTVFGATSKVSETSFNAPTLSLAEALARIGGPLDDRADPNAVFLFRFENPEIATRLGLPVRPGVAAAPVVYQLDMMNPTSYFLAQQFEMKNKDLVYIANAKTNGLYKFINLISLIASPAITAAYLAKN
ncbi:polysaccharide biosynthesis/export family protein [Acidisoma cladoniae]|uniref:polysaccharide biosynthesis/export family protein n=1 Tax=Acidisoma cladoniae TaxID=3040935 RepID=UPI002550844E|nr:polysaccharide biosynthesis/export family protein [Acidisoma sp. PAMC 29798]